MRSTSVHVLEKAVSTCYLKEYYPSIHINKVESNSLQKTENRVDSQSVVRIGYARAVVSPDDINQYRKQKRSRNDDDMNHEQIDSIGRLGWNQMDRLMHQGCRRLAI